VISPQNRYVLAQCSQNVDLYDLHQKNVIRLYDGEDDIREMRMDGPEAWIYIRTRRTALAWQLIDGKAFQTEAPGLPDTDRSPNSQDGRYALKIIDNNTLALWDIGTNQSIREYASTSSKIFKVYFDANDEYVVARCSGHRMPFYRIWEKDTGRLAAAFENDGAPDILIRGARRFVKYYKHPHTVLFDLKSKKQLLAWRDIGKTTIFRNDGKTYVSYGLGPDFWHYSLFELPDFDRLFEWALCEIRPS